MAAPAEATTIQADVVFELIGRGAYRDAAGACARLHGPAIGRLCMALLGAQAEAEEALQDTLLAAHDAMATYRGEGTVRAWLFGIARRMCARRIEARVRDRRLQLVHDADADARLPDADAEAARRARAVRAALARLQPTEREALVLRYQGGLSYREVAQACGIEEATARKRAGRGLDHLRALLGPEGSEP
jgi:RNA polymerase sigma-70 factor, ECF subfamily